VIISENRNLAESNLEMEPRLIEIRSRINDLTSEGKSLSSSVQEKLQQISESSQEKFRSRQSHYPFQFSESKSSSMNPESMLDILKAAAAESEEKSDKIAEDLLEQNLTFDEFLDQFKPSRMEMHLRKLKVDKMQELLRKGPSNGPPPPSHMNYPPGVSNFYGTPNQTPYPSMPGYPMMPMPPTSYRPPY
jgi:ESCRT-I complex subunit VPS37